MKNKIVNLKNFEDVFYKQVLHQCNDFIVITDQVGVVLYVNPSFEIHTGYSLKIIKGKNISIVKSGVHNLTFYKKLWSNLKKGNPTSNIFINKKKNGELYYENKTITPIKDEKGKIKYFLSTSKDITHDVMMQKSLVAKNNFINTTLQNIDALIVGINFKGEIVLFNHTCEKQTGYKASEVIGKDVFKTFIPGVIKPDIKEVFKGILTKDKKYRRMVYNWKTKSNGEIKIRWSNTMIKDFNTGEDIVLATGIDISTEYAQKEKLEELNKGLDIKVSERTAEIEKLNREISSRSAILGKMLDNLPAVIYLLDNNEDTIKFIGVNFSDKFKFPFEANQQLKVTQFLKGIESIQDGSPISKKQFIDNYSEFRYKKINGGIIFQNKISVFEKGRGNKVNSYIGFMTDISLVKEIQFKLEESQKIAKIGTWEWNIQTNELFWSSEIYNIFEIDPAKFSPSYPKFLEVVHPHDRKSIEAAVEEAIVKRKPYHIKHRLQPRPGLIKYVEEKGSANFDSDGSPLRMLGTVRDITEMEYYRDRLNESQKLANLGTWEWNVMDNELFLSDESYNILGISKSNANLKINDFFNYIHPEDNERVLNEILNDAINSEFYFDIEYRIICPNREVKHIVNKGKIELNAENTPYKIIGAIQNITEEKELRLKLLNSYTTLENSLNAIFTSDMNGKIEYGNKTACAMWGYSSLAEMLLEKPNISDYWKESEADKINECILEIISSGRYYSQAPFIAIDSSNKEMFVRFNASLLKDESGKAIGITAAFFNITTEVKIKKEIEEYDKKLALLLGNIDEIVYGIEVDEENYLNGKIFYLSKKSEKVIGFNFDELSANTDMWMESIHPEDKRNVIFLTKKAINSKRSVTRMYRFYNRRTKLYIWLEDKITPEFDVSGRIKYIYGSARDVSDKIIKDILLQESEKKYRMIYENASVGIFRTNILTQRPVEANEVCIKLFGYDSKEDFMGNFLASDHYFDQDQREELMKELLENQKLESREIIFTKKNSEIFWGNVSAKIIPDAGILEGVIVDVSQRKSYEEALKKNLVEKEILLKEVHHRVKNNLQVITSLLKLQMNKIEDPIVKLPLLESQERIKAISLIHEKLYLSEDISSINFTDYLMSISKSIQSINKDLKVDLVFDMADLFLDIDKAVPLGLACYEIVTNAFKHAFKDSYKGVIYFTSFSNGNEHNITIKDSGKGFNIDNLNSTNSLGWTLIKRLTQQANCKLNVWSEPLQGTIFEIGIEEIA